MSNPLDERRYKEEKPVVAICYDFDKTLTPTDMQEQGYMQAVGYTPEEFWPESNGLARDNDMDQNSAYMYMMIDKAKGKLLINKQILHDLGKSISFFPGVEDWFDRTKKYGEEKGVIVEHYIISSGLKEIIEGTSIAENGVFEKIYANAFYYNDHGEPVWPAQIVNYTNKTQFLFRIEKGVLNVNDDAVNNFYEPDKLRVPFRNMVYIGDSDTDIPCMKLVNTYGGYSIGVFNSAKMDKTKVQKMIKDGRIRYYVPADYTENSELDQLIQIIIDRTAYNEKLENIHYNCYKETVNNDEKTSVENKKKINLILSLDSSRSFSRTHEIISELLVFNTWSNEHKEQLFDIAINNSQVFYILKDTDVKMFYSKLLLNMKKVSENAKKVKDIINV